MRATTRRFSVIVAALVVLALALVAAGCGSSSDNNSSGSSSGSSSASGGGGGGIYGGGGGGMTASSTSSGGSGAVSVDDNAKLGQILVDSKGNTLYYFLKDKNGKSACSGACATVWPPYTASGQPTAQGGAKASLLATSKRDDGTMQVTYNNFPLYTYTGDSKPGDANGNDLDQFGGEWYAITPQGDKPAD